MVFMELKKFCVLLKDMRESKHMRKKHLAESLSVHQSYITKLEKGESLPATRERLLQIAHALNLSEDEKKELFHAAFRERLSESDRALLDDLVRWGKSLGE